MSTRGPFSARTDFDAHPNALTAARRERVAAGHEVLDLTVSNPTTAGLPYADAQLLEALADRRSLRYAAHPFGLPSARAVVAAELGIDPSRVVLTASSSEAYGWLFKLLCDPGDSVLSPRPSYPLFDQLAAFEGIGLIGYPLAYDGAWHVDLPGLRAAVDDRTRAILAVSPNNPTGQVLRRGELRAMAALGVPIIVDEVFAAYRFGSVPDAARVLDDSDALVFSLGGLSKAAGLPQMKLGWIAIGGPDALVGPAMERLELIADTWLSLGTPVQWALPTLLTHRRVTVDAIRCRLAKNHERLCDMTSGTPISVLPADGGWYAVLALPRIMDDGAWALAVLDETGVYVQPGFFYDFDHDGHIVVSLLTPPAVFADGIDRLVHAVARRCG